MKYPKINKQPQREITLPELSGGLNFRDSLVGINDNQLTDCVNMWYKDGALKTRPAFEVQEDDVSITKINNIKQTKRKIIAFPEISIGGYILMSMPMITKYNYMIIAFWWQSKSCKKGLSCLEVLKVQDDYSYFVVEKDGVAYCFFNGSEKFGIYKIDCDFEAFKWTEVKEDEMYIPTIATHCKTLGKSICSSDEVFKNGIQLEGYNLLGNKYKLIYSTVNPSLLTDDDSEHLATYTVLQNLLDGTYAGEKVEVTITDINGLTCTHSVTIPSGKPKSVIEELPQEDGLIMQVIGNQINLIQSQISQPKKYKKEEFVEDNMVITAPCHNTKENMKKVFAMTKSTWFGGAANGISGGSRLFLCGNTEKKDQALVIWSALNNPLYFNENNYVYVGNKEQPVTTFGKQGENLVIFKPYETYYTYYVANDSITAEDLIYQRVVDYEANSVYFPMITLHSEIGCDCPHTVQLCRNRLVWLNSNGKVYTLMSNNQYSEMNIYEISEMVEKRLRGKYDEQELKSAVSGDFEGNYILIIGGDAYLMCYNSYGYTHIYSYTKAEDANKLIPWYYWELLPSDESGYYDGLCYCCANNCIYAAYLNTTVADMHRICSCVLKDENKNNQDMYFKNNNSTDLVLAQKDIPCKFQTKMFDFSVPHYLKDVGCISVSFENNDCAPINISFVSNSGTEIHTIELDGSETSNTQANYISVKNLYPSMRAVRIWGILIECKGQLAVDRMSIKYRILGGAK